MEDLIQVEVTGDADAVTSESYVENTIGNLVWHTVEENHSSLIFENIEKVIKHETDIIEDYVWESTIEIMKNVEKQSNTELPLECQDVADNNIYLNHENTSDKIFHCNICGKSFVLNYLLKNHLARHKRQVQYKTNICKFCGKQFLSKFGFNIHIEKHHNSMYRCTFCKLRFIDRSNYIKHKKSHKRRDQTHDLDYVPVSELNNHMENIHNKHLFKCQKCNQQFQKQIHLNCHLSQCLRSYRTKSNKVCSKIMANEKTCSACGIVFNNSLSLKNHITFGCKHYSCKYCGQFFSERNFWLNHILISNLEGSTEETSSIRQYSQTEDVNNSFFNTHGEPFLSRDATGKNSSNHTRLVNSTSTIVSNAAQNSESESNTFDTNNENIQFEPNVMQNIISIEDNNTGSATMSRNHKKETKSSSIKKTNFCAKIHTLNMYKCNVCGQQFETILARDNHVWENHSDDISTSNKN